ncbi:hypothetical protein WR25_13949 isoform B [Diploscapter pachys]|uniref:Sodium/hydrogen exchanger n=1 Tax=Diploscapter pachys TaxID=2018661 RepID=A0A2A2J8N6_9BILA|nr:hypothetical protein WR25_13949 isoform B [Diploscapter pachys]
MQYLRLYLLLLCYGIVAEQIEDHANEQPADFQILRFNFRNVQAPYVIALWLVVAALAKIAFNLSRLSHYVPDSALLIVVGILLGLLLHKTQTDLDYYSLDSHTFFLYLLPPIIFDAGYFMPNRALFESIRSVLLFAIIGTIWNTFAIGISLLIMSNYGLFSMSFTTFEIFVFSALISAVDPVAVIAVFEEINVNEFLFINVFGEALFNDGVTVVLYQMFKAFAIIGSDNLTIGDYASGSVSFIVVAVGGAFIGVFFAFITSLVTKYTQGVRILAPVFIFTLPYLAYLTAEMISLSSIIAIAVCGMVMKMYVKGNISHAAANSVKYFTKMVAQSTEIVIFMFLGLSTISSDHHWDTLFVISTLVFCLLYRIIGVVAQCYLLNKFGNGNQSKEFSKVDQFILSYGGLRGAIAFGLAASIPVSIVAKPMFVTTTIAVIYFTVFLQGITIRPLVQLLKIKTKEERIPTMAETVYMKYLDYMMSGVEDIAGQRGTYSFVEDFERFNAKIIKPILMRNEKRQTFDATRIVRAYEKITLEDAMKMALNKEPIKHKSVARIKGTEVPIQTAINNDLTLTPADRQLGKVGLIYHHIKESKNSLLSCS